MIHTESWYKSLSASYDSTLRLLIESFKRDAISKEEFLARLEAHLNRGGMPAGEGLLRKSKNKLYLTTEWMEAHRPWSHQYQNLTVGIAEYLEDRMDEAPDIWQWEGTGEGKFLTDAEAEYLYNWNIGMNAPSLEDRLSYFFKSPIPFKSEKDFNTTIQREIAMLKGILARAKRHFESGGR